MRSLLETIAVLLLLWLTFLVLSQVDMTQEPETFYDGEPVTFYDKYNPETRQYDR